ncbi:hypothetical protein ERY430_40674 [Erythrobacter sp. EC-HK427]|nr:hypothetical protein ERY430_40674 [Erythrobacter sp. EC-HK427]
MFHRSLWLARDFGARAGSVTDSPAAQITLPLAPTQQRGDSPAYQQQDKGDQDISDQDTNLHIAPLCKWRRDPRCCDAA